MPADPSPTPAEIAAHLLQVVKDGQVHVKLPYQLRYPTARKVLAEVVKQRGSLPVSSWGRLRGIFEDHVLGHINWKLPGIELYSSLATDIPTNPEHNEATFEELHTEVLSTLDTGTPDVKSILALGYEVDPWAVYTTDEFPDRDVARYLASHPETPSDLLVQASEELNTWFYDFAAHPNFPAEAVPRQYLFGLFQRFAPEISETNLPFGMRSTGRVFTRLWEDDAYDEELLALQPAESQAVSAAVFALGLYGNDESLSEVLEMKNLGATGATMFLTGLSRRADNVDSSLLSEVLKKYAGELWRRDRTIGHLNLYSIWMKLILSRERMTWDEAEVLLPYGRKYVPEEQWVWLEDTLRQSQELKGRTYGAQHRDFERRMRAYPMFATASPELIAGYL